MTILSNYQLTTQKNWHWKSRNSYLAFREDFYREKHLFSYQFPFGEKKSYSWIAFWSSYLFLFLTASYRVSKSFFVGNIFGALWKILSKHFMFDEFNMFELVYRGIWSILWSNEHNESPYDENDETTTRRATLWGNGILPTPQPKIASCSWTTLKL